MPAEEFEAAEQIWACVPPEAHRDVVGVNAQVQLRPFLIAVGLERKRQPGAERLIAGRPVQLWEMRMDFARTLLAQPPDRRAPAPTLLLKSRR